MFVLLLLGCEQPISNKPKIKSSPLPLIETYTVKSQSFPIKQTYSGSVVAQRWARIFTQEIGKINYLPFHEGDKVKKGQLLIQLDDYLLNAELTKAKSLYQQAQLKVKRLQKLVKKRLIAQQELDQADTELANAKADIQILTIRLGYTKIYAPFKALITQRLAETYDIVDSHTHVLTLIDPASFVVSTQVFDVVPIEKGAKVSVQIDALNHQSYQGKVERFYPAAAENPHLFTVEIKITTLPQKIQLGQFCRIHFQKTSLPLLTVPYTAIQRDVQGEFVFVVDTENHVARQPVQVGARLAKHIEIIKGLVAGQHIVIKGFFGLKIGQQVKVVDQVN